MLKGFARFQRQIQYEKRRARPYMRKRRYIYYEMILIGLITSTIMLLIDEYSGTFSTKMSLLTIALIGTAWLYRHEIVKNKSILK